MRMAIEPSAAEAKVSSTVPDWSRERPRRLWDPSRRLLQSIRGYQRHRGKGLWHGLARKYWAGLHRFWSVITQAEIDLNCQIGGGLMLPHPNGIVIHPAATIGPNCLIFQQVTLTGGRISAPRLGGHVDIGAGAKLLGDIVLGDHCVVGANAVVLQDVPAGVTVVGIPAKPVVRKPA